MSKAKAAYSSDLKAVLTTLRTASGVLQDLAELAAPILERERERERECREANPAELGVGAFLLLQCS